MRRGPDSPGRRLRPEQALSRPQKQAVVWAAEQNLKPWELHPPKPKPSVPLAKKPTKAYEKPESLDHRLRVAFAAPVSRQARNRLANTMTPERKKEVAKSYLPTR